MAFAGFAIFGDNPLGGEPVAHVAMRQKAHEEKAAAPAAPPAHAAKSEPKEAAPGEQRTVTIIDGSSGKRQDVVIGGGEASASDKPAAEKAESDAAAPPATTMAGADLRLLEKTRYGMIPIAAENLKPFTAYDGPVDQARAAKMPVVAIVVGGLGVGAAKTSDAIMRLPGAVTLAFTPYGSDPGKRAEKARAQRHEIFLRLRWSRRIIPTMIPARRPCWRPSAPSKTSTGCSGISGGCRPMPASPISWARASSPPMWRWPP